MKKYNIYICFILSFGLLLSCNQGKKTEEELVVPIYCDDDFKPIISSSVDVFENIQSPRGIIPIYGNEKEAFELLMTDSIRLIVVSRPISEPEKKKLEGTHKMIARNVLVGYDGLAIIVNKGNPDSLISTTTLKKIFTGEIEEWNKLSPKSKLGTIQPVFNNPLSGTVRYVKDSVCNGAELSTNLKALNTNQEVLEYVSKTPNAMGIIGVSWISNERDTLQLSFSEAVSVMRISREDPVTKYNSFQPFQYYIRSGEYPLVRELYIVHSDPAYGTQRKFADFMARDKGQLIIKNAGLLPLSTTTTVKQIRTKDNL